MRRRSLAVLGAVAWCVLFSTAASAQSVTDRPFEPITYSEVLAHPNDPAVNYRWARTQIARGDLKGASATLERMLLINPGQPDIRLLYAVLLYRLGSYAEAGDQLHQINRDALDPASRAEIDRYLADIDQRLRHTRYWAVASLGAQYDTNRNLAPTGETPVPNIPPTLFTAPGVGDFGFIGYGALGLHQDLGMQGRAELTADAWVYDDTQDRVRSLDTLATQARVGAILRTDVVNVTPNLMVSGLWLGSRTQFYYQSFGLDLHLDKTLDQMDRRLTLFGDVEVLDEIFHAVSLDPFAYQSTGGHYSFDLGASYRLLENVTVFAILQNTIKDAETPGRAFCGNNGILSANWLFAPGQFLQGTVQYGVFPYRGIDPTVDPIHVRRDDIFDAKATYGIGLDTLFGTTGASFLRDLTWSVSVERIQDQSTVGVYKSNDTRVLTLFTKQLDF